MTNQDNIKTIHGTLGSYRDVPASREIIGAAIDVHKELGPGFLESVYHNSLCILLSERGIEFEKEPEVPVFFHDVEVGTHRLDILIPDQLVVELKAVKALEKVDCGPPGSAMAFSSTLVRPGCSSAGSAAIDLREPWPAATVHICRGVLMTLGCGGARSLPPGRCWTTQPPKSWAIARSQGPLATGLRLARLLQIACRSV
ncbi:GxxExxY protein [Myxococcota bacterium]